jgi:hypothetical protein
MATIRVLNVTFEKGRATIAGNPIGAKTGRTRRDRIATFIVSREEGHKLRRGMKARVS